MITATLDGLQFSTEAGATYTIERLEGWYGSPPVKTQVDERPRADGSFALSDFQRSARPITVSGQVHTSDAGQSSWSALAAACGLGVPRLLTVTDVEGPRSAVVMPYASGLSLTPITAETAVYVLSLLAFDPVKYGPDRAAVTGVPTAGGGLQYPLHNAGVLEYGANGDLGRVTVTNSGTAGVWPVFTVTGVFTNGFNIRRLDLNRTITYARVVPAGTTVTIDSRTGSVLIDGTSDGSTFLTRSEFFSAGPGESFEVQVSAIDGSSGTPQMTVTSSDGFW